MISEENNKDRDDEDTMKFVPMPGYMEMNPMTMSDMTMTPSMMGTMDMNPMMMDSTAMNPPMMEPMEMNPMMMGSIPMNPPMMEPMGMSPMMMDSMPMNPPMMEPMEMNPMMMGSMPMNPTIMEPMEMNPMMMGSMPMNPPMMEPMGMSPMMMDSISMNPLMNFIPTYLMYLPTLYMFPKTEQQSISSEAAPVAPPMMEFERDMDISENRGINEDVEMIFRKIERNNPGILRTLMSYRIPYPVARNIIKRIIRLSLIYKK